MKSFFGIRRSRGPVDLAMGMAGVRLGERLLQVGQGDPVTFARAAGLAGLTGRACAVVDAPEAAAALEGAASNQGVFVEVSVAAGQWPYEQQAFDVAMVDGNMLLAGDSGRRGAVLGELRRVVRPGGRIVAVFRHTRTLAIRLGFGSSGGSGDESQQMLAAFEAAGLRPARFLGAREGLVFVEAFRPA